MKTYETCPQGLDCREWRKFLDLIEHHKQRATVKRATGLQPGRVSPIGAVPDPIHRMGGR
jgi:prolyl-tRNA editing enzyme YbaK/EbsC (Cys-tRNA(Pro) deacylase)